MVIFAEPANFWEIPESVTIWHSGGINSALRTASLRLSSLQAVNTRHWQSADVPLRRTVRATEAAGIFQGRAVDESSSLRSGQGEPPAHRIVARDRSGSPPDVEAFLRFCTAGRVGNLDSGSGPAILILALKAVGGSFGVPRLRGVRGGPPEGGTPNLPT